MLIPLPLFFTKKNHHIFRLQNIAVTYPKRFVWNSVFFTGFRNNVTIAFSFVYIQ